MLGTFAHQMRCRLLRVQFVFCGRPNDMRQADWAASVINVQACIVHVVPDGVSQSAGLGPGEDSAHEDVNPVSFTVGASAIPAWARITDIFI